MAIVFSPLADEELTSDFTPLPKHGFIMVHSAAEISPVEARIEKIVGEMLRRQGFRTKKAADEVGTKDYLHKIVRLIRGCGFGVAIFSASTPSRTLATIFFEIGLAHVLGKDVLMIKTADATIPSDFVRTEWIDFRPTDEAAFRKRLSKACDLFRKNAEFYSKLGTVALEARIPDLELAFERYRQAHLLIGDEGSLGHIRAIRARLAKLAQEYPETGHLFRRLHDDVDRFLNLGPAGERRDG